MPQIYLTTRKQAVAVTYLVVENRWGKAFFFAFILIAAMYDKSI